MGCCVIKPKEKNLKVSQISIDQGKTQQGTQELKQNYIFKERDKKSIITLTEYGKVVKCPRRNDPTSFVAIKVFEKKKLGR